jgi:sterol desaturase/sphingolipid hydroxylase (fatty acid hydroxylase superfamily)
MSSASAAPLVASETGPLAEIVPFFERHGAWVGAGLVVLLVAEQGWRYLHHRDPRRLRESASNVAILLVGESLRTWLLPLRYAALALAYEASPWSHAPTLLGLAVCYLSTDFVLYAWHRLLHASALGWAFHSVHHTSRQLDLSVAGRLSWIQHYLLDDLVYLPLALAGFHPAPLLFCITLNRLSQFWLHTEAIGRLRWLELLVNTPAAHRLHHADGEGAKRSNYGSNLLVWDHLFGTYRAPTAERFAYGTDLGDIGPYVARIQFVGLRRWLRRGRER